MTLTSQIDAAELRVGVWFKPEGHGPDRTIVTVSTDNAPPSTSFVYFDKPTEISIPMTWRTGDVISLRMMTPHRASRAEGEQRDLAFTLLSVVAV